MTSYLLNVNQGGDGVEIEFVHTGSLRGLDKFHVHIKCFAGWELERHNVDGTG